MIEKLAKNSTELASTQIERFYRRKILAGEIEAGTKLPSNQSLAKLWSTSTAAIQEALSTLAGEGLLERRRRKGTFIRSTSNSDCVGILIGPNLIQETAGFYRILCDALQCELIKYNLSARVYDNLTFPDETHSVDSRNLLRLDRQNYNFKGYIFIATSNVLEKKLPENLQPASFFQDIIRGRDVEVDKIHFLEESLSQLVNRGFKRFTYFRTTLSKPRDENAQPVPGLEELSARMDLPSPTLWSVQVSGASDSYEREVDQILNERIENKSFPIDKKSLPDVFLVQDDVSARPLILNLLRRGVRIPQDVRVCIQATKGLFLYYGVPVYRYEISAQAIAEALVQLLSARVRSAELSDLPRSVRGQFRDYSL
jgi:DNA-binding transcriptional regulator YhcF (GntR family)/DNA-binding LacI/PurR family transcriptional regulator